MGDSVQLWDEFEPALYKLKIDFKGETNGKEINEKLGDKAEELWMEAEQYMRKFEFKTGNYRDDLSYHPE